jgi:hypothetical protein
LRKMCQDHNPGLDPPGTFSKLAQFHYVILGKEDAAYIETKGKKSATDGAFHCNFFAQKCNKKAFKALKKLYANDAKLKMNKKYRAMAKFNEDQLEKVLTWVTTLPKVKQSTWRGINAMCSTISKKKIQATQMRDDFMDKLYAAEIQAIEQATEVCF